MPFIGNQPALSYTSFAKQDFTTSATTSYTLDHPVTNENEIALFINFVRQEPTTAYTASSTSLTLTSATSATDDMYCVFLGKAVQTVNPPVGSVGASQISDGSIALGKLSATGTKDATTFLRGDNSFAVPAGGTNTPYFEARLSSSQTGISNGVWTKVSLNTELQDSDNCFDNSSYRFQPNAAGKYYLSGSIYVPNNGNTTISMASIYKNGSRYETMLAAHRTDYSSSVVFSTSTATFSSIITMNGSSDYVELYGLHQANSGTIGFSHEGTLFKGYKIIE